MTIGPCLLQIFITGISFDARWSIFEDRVGDVLNITMSKTQTNEPVYSRTEVTTASVSL